MVPSSIPKTLFLNPFNSLDSAGLVLVQDWFLNRNNHVIFFSIKLSIFLKYLQPRCQGARVEYVPRKNTGDKDQKGGKRGQSARSRSASAKRGRSASLKRGKSAGRKKSGKKSAKKRR